MEKKIDLNKRVFNKTEYVKTINTNFAELGNKSIVEEIKSTPTVEDFFELYNNLFYEIPERGEDNSHEFLVQTSGELINFEQENEEIEALREEITQLRQDLLNAKIENVELQTNSNINNTQIEELKSNLKDSSKSSVLEDINKEISNS